MAERLLLFTVISEDEVIGAALAELLLKCLAHASLDDNS
jgi:hypothetical protein